MRVCIVTASNQNVFFGELLSAFASGLARAGVEVEWAEDHFPPPADDLVYLFVPHEYYPLVERDSAPTPRQLLRSVALCTEQPGTPWFEEGARVAADAGAAVDINHLGVAELRRRGVEATLVPLGYVPEWDHWHGAEDVPRRVDLTFMGGYTERRALALARCGVVLQNRTAGLHVFNTIKPHAADDRWFLSGERKWEALSDAKAILNVHRSPLAYMEWQRVVGAVCNGCVVVTEHSLGFEPFIPDTHFISAAFDDLHLAVEALLNDPARLTRIRTEAYRLLVDEMPMTTSAETLAAVLEDVAGRRLLTPDPGEPAPLPRPKPPVVFVPDPFAPNPDGTSPIRRALKQLVLESRAIRARLEPVIDDPDLPEYVVEDFGPAARIPPRVSVVITLYNYADVVAQAIESVALSDHDTAELLVVDDGSRDQSAVAARDALMAAPWLSSRLVLRQRNAGLAAARNLGVSLARGEYVFMLDADNTIYPHALARLEHALDEDPTAVFSYGILEVFGYQGPRGLLSWVGWDPVWLRYDNPVDAMAMFRRDALMQIGGYTSEPSLYGWEDFALWCAFAAADHVGTRVPEIVARYRAGADSMIATTNIDASAAWATLYRQYPSVFGT